MRKKEDLGEILLVLFLCLIPFLVLVILEHYSTTP